MKKWLSEIKKKCMESIASMKAISTKDDGWLLEEEKTPLGTNLGTNEEAKKKEAYDKWVSDTRTQPGPLTMVALLRHYGDKGLTRPGKLIEILEDEMQYLLTEDEAHKWEAEASEADVGLSLGSRKGTGYSTGVSAMVKSPGSPTTLPGVRTMSSDGVHLEEENFTVFLDDHNWGNHVYLARPWTNYKTIVGRDIPDFFCKDKKWCIAMFLGVEEFQDDFVGSSVSIGERFHGSLEELHEASKEATARKAKWGKWLIGERVYVGWVHPDAMKCIEALF